jgi:hypothetical protein
MAVEHLGEIFMPVGAAVEAGHVVVHLTAADHSIAVGLEVCRDGCHAAQRLVPDGAVVIDAGRGWKPPGHRGHARWIADRRGDVRVGEQRPALRQPVDVRRLHVGVAAEASDPIVHVVHDDHEDVGPVGGLGSLTAGKAEECERRWEKSFHCDERLYRAFFFVFFFLAGGAGAGSRPKK